LDALHFNLVACFERKILILAKPGDIIRTYDKPDPEMTGFGAKNSNVATPLPESTGVINLNENETVPGPEVALKSDLEQAFKVVKGASNKVVHLDAGEIKVVLKCPKCSNMYDHLRPFRRHIRSRHKLKPGSDLAQDMAGFQADDPDINNNTSAKVSRCQSLTKLFFFINGAFY
jgi:hypothetical protein